jgi:hypothetical protein
MNDVMKDVRTLVRMFPRAEFLAVSLDMYYALLEQYSLSLHPHHQTAQLVHEKWHSLDVCKTHFRLWNKPVVIVDKSLDYWIKK